ncbi:hypothetical protein L9W76_11525 [Vibrio aestuarianus]|uniref:hypothetical protein n=1 Tax=Vibrio aestuarianus TaxID=28171 RepID=UPI00237CA5F9|nr:hypothetical protein [Vibrio aestuarianus]MDE1253799.1 hypothetical protein [Vibrio aestuarianus]
MNIFKIIFLASVISFSSLSFSAGENKIYSSDIVKGSLRGYNIEFKIEFREEGGIIANNRKQDPYGRITVRMNDGDPDADLVVFDRTKSNSLSNVDSITLRGTLLTSKGESDPYFTLINSSLRDDDGSTGSNKLCSLRNTTRVHKSQVDETISDIIDGRDCKSFKLLKFSAL